MSGSRYVMPYTQWLGPDGPLAGAKLFFYETGTTTPQPTYSNVGLTVPNTNPVIADSLGTWGNIFLLPSPSYRVTLTDANDVEIWTADPVSTTLTAITGDVALGSLVAFAGTSAPPGYLLCYGQAVSRVTYVDLFGVIGTTWGVGDAATTFNVPDLRGRAVFGRDDMGGVAANRLTTAQSNVDGLTVGATGGDQQDQIHTHDITDTGHSHSVTDPGHRHVGDGGTIIVFVGSPNGNVQATTGTGFIGAETDDAVTNITIDSGMTGITINTYGTSNSHNIPPAGVVNWLIFAGV